MVRSGLAKSLTWNPIMTDAQKAAAEILKYFQEQFEGLIAVGLDHMQFGELAEYENLDDVRERIRQIIDKHLC